ncbi:MAG: hypothetical protein HQ567_30245 [Candidatus Nealsonbacteria bacterium]|nr:hypothetical protein [Candidatus Nealsonbacteria bacterium]
MITVVLLGRSVDRADRSENARIVREFLQLPHIRRLLPAKLDLNPVCMCNPNMTVGAAWYAFGLAFPGFVHDVVWNHSLCKIKDLVETEG